MPSTIVLFRLVLLAVASVFAAEAIAQPAALRDLRLQDQRARIVTPGSLQGRPLLLNFVFTGCSSSCPVQTLELSMLQAGLPADVRAVVQLLSVTVDPAHDTPQTLAAFTRLHQVDVPGWRFATGEPADVETLIARMAATDLRKQPRRPEDHRTSLWLFDDAGGLVQRYAGMPVDRVRLTDEITRLVRQKKK